MHDEYMAIFTLLKSRVEPIFERVSVSALHLREAVYAPNADIMRERSVIDVDALVSGMS